MITKENNKPTKNKHLTSDNRQIIKEMLGKGRGYVEIASAIGKSPTLQLLLQYYKINLLNIGIIYYVFII